MYLRKILFWTHLIAGCAGGVVILIMSLTGVLLMYERQILARVERGPFRSVPAAGAGRLPVEDLLARAKEQRGGLPPNATLTLRADPTEPAELTVGRESTLYVSPYTGQLLGEPSTRWRAFFRDVTAWHRWLGAQGQNRATAKAITGACNLAFLLLIVSGPFLWLPKRWTRQHLAPIAWFRRGISGKARDFNWHNVLGIWCAVPLFLIVLTAAPMSYQWANNLLFRMAGSAPPAAGRPGERRGGGGEVELAGLERLWRRVAEEQPGWRSIAMRLPDSPRRPVTFTVDTGDGGQPQKRATLTLDRASGAVVRRETFSENDAGRRLRSWSRFVHTGEAFGMAGQTIAGAASLAGAVLVWTGIALTLRRMAAWRRRRSASARRVNDGIAAAVAIVLLAGTASASGPPGTLNGRVVDERRAAIAGARVVALPGDGRRPGFTVSASAEGQFTLPLRVGFYTVHIAMPGFEDTWETVVIREAGQDVSRDFVLERPKPQRRRPPASPTYTGN